MTSHRAHIIATTRITTTAGRGVRFVVASDYPGAIPGGQVIYLQTDTRALHISVTARSAAAAERYAKRITSSLRYTY